MNRKQVWIILLLLTIFVVIVRLPSLEEPLDNDSGAVAYHARQMLRGEPLYGKFHPAFQPPGSYYTFKLAFELLGDRQIAPKLLLLLFVTVCAWLLFLLGRSFVNNLTGILGAIFFTLVSSQILLNGMTAKIEPFANLPLTAGVFLIVSIIRKQAPAWQYIWVGLVGSICMLYKVIYVTPLALAGISILIMTWLDRNQVHPWKIALIRFFWMFVGFIVPVGMIGAHYASLGLWNRILLIFTLGLSYLNDSSLMSVPWLPRPFGFPLFWMSVNNITLLVFGLLGAYRFTRRSIPVRNTNNLIDLIPVLWLIISFALTGLRGGGFPYYVQLTVPPLAFMGAVEIGDSYQRWMNAYTKRTAALGAGILTALVVINFAWANIDLYSHYVSYKLDRISYRDFLYGYKGTGPRSWNAQIIADYITDHTVPDDHIYLWSTDVQLYYFSDRTPPVDILWPIYVSATGPAERIFTSQTKYIIVDMPERLARPEWLLDGLARSYQLETVIGEKEVYRRQTP